MSVTVPPASTERPAAAAPEATAKPTPLRRSRTLLPAAADRTAVAIDLTAVVAGVLLAAIGFRPTYAGSRWFWVALFGAVLGAALGYLSRALRTSALSTALIGIAGLFLAGAISVPRTAVAGMLPGPETPAAIFDGITRGWARILTTVPPVGTIDHLQAIIWGCTFLAAFIAVLLALNTRLSAVPAVPAIVVLVITALIGTDRPASTLLSGAALAAVVITWTSLRYQRRRPMLRVKGSASDRQRFTAVGFIAGAVVLGILASSVLPFSDRDRFVVREHTEPPFDPRAHPSPLSQHQHWRDRALPHETNDFDESDDKIDNTPVLVVEGLPEGVPLALASMDIYDGTAWLVGGSASESDRSGSSRFERVGTDLTAARVRSGGEASPAPSVPTKNVTVTVRNEGYTGPWLPIPAGSTGIDFGGDRADALASDLRYNRATGTAAVLDGFRPGDRLTARAAVPASAYAVGDARAALVGDAALDPAVEQPGVIDPSKSLAARANSLGGGGSDYARAVALEKALNAKGAGYFSDGRINGIQSFTAGHNAAKLHTFLTQTGPDGNDLFVGNSEKFAASMAVMARQLGLPARVVVGFREKANDRNVAKRTGDTVTFSADQYDAWVEIAFAGRGWVAFYPTPPRSNGEPPEAKTEVPKQKDAEVQAPPPIIPPPDIDNITPQREADRDKSDTEDDDALVSLPSWLSRLVRIVVPIVAVLALVIGGVLGWKAWRRRRRRRTGTPVQQLDGAWREMADSLRDTGQPVSRLGTRRQVAAAIPVEQWRDAPAFADRLDTAMFGREDPDEASVHKIWGEVDDLRKDLKGRHGVFARFKAAMNPKTLWSWR